MRFLLFYVILTFDFHIFIVVYVKLYPIIHSRDHELCCQLGRFFGCRKRRGFANDQIISLILPKINTYLPIKSNMCKKLQTSNIVEWDSESIIKAEKKFMNSGTKFYAPQRGMLSFSFLSLLTSQTYKPRFKKYAWSKNSQFS